MQLFSCHPLQDNLDVRIPIQFSVLHPDTYTYFFEPFTVFRTVFLIKHLGFFSLSFYPPPPLLIISSGELTTTKKCNQILERNWIKTESQHICFLFDFSRTATGDNLKNYFVYSNFNIW